MAVSIQEMLKKKFGKSDEEASKISYNINNMASPDQMKGSQIWLVPKKENPNIHNEREFRPVDPTNMGYKIFMEIYRKRLKDNFAKSMTEETMEENLLIMQDLVLKANAEEKTLIAITTDYDCWAYEKFNRDALLTLLAKYTGSQQFANTIGNNFVDSTLIRYKDYKSRINVSSGLRRSCPLSGIVLLLMKRCIKENIVKKGKAFEIGNESFHILWFADTPVILADSLKNAKENLKIFIDVSKSFGLNVDKDKSNVVIFNDREGIKDIENIKVRNTFKNNKCFRDETSPEISEIPDFPELF